MLYLHSTTKLAKSLKLNLAPPPSNDQMHWLDCWYMNRIGLGILGLPLDAFVFLNAKTKYALIHPYDSREPLEETVELFRVRLGQITKRKPSADFTVCKNSSRSVIGCLNELVHTVIYVSERMLHEDGVKFEKIEDYWNNGIIKMQRPLDSFNEMLGKGNGPLLKETSVPHLRIVE